MILGKTTSDSTLTSREGGEPHDKMARFFTQFWWLYWEFAAVFIALTLNYYRKQYLLKYELLLISSFFNTLHNVISLWCIASPLFLFYRNSKISAFLSNFNFITISSCWIPWKQKDSWETFQHVSGVLIHWQWAMLSYRLPAILNSTLRLFPTLISVAIYDYAWRAGVGRPWKFSAKNW